MKTLLTLFVLLLVGFSKLVFADTYLVCKNEGQIIADKSSRYPPMTISLTLGGFINKSIIVNFENNLIIDYSADIKEWTKVFIRVYRNESCETYNHIYAKYYWGDSFPDRYKHYGGTCSTEIKIDRISGRLDFIEDTKAGAGDITDLYFFNCEINNKPKF